MQLVVALTMMYKYLTIAVFIVGIAATAMAEDAEPDNFLYENPMDLNHDGVVSVEEANLYAAKRQPPKKIAHKPKRVLFDDPEQRHVRHDEDKYSPVYIKPLENTGAFYWN